MSAIFPATARVRNKICKTAGKALGVLQIQRHHTAAIKPVDNNYKDSLFKLPFFFVDNLELNSLEITDFFP